MTHVYDLEAEVIAEIERLEREAKRIHDLPNRPAPKEEQRALARKTAEIREQVGRLLPDLS